MTLADLAQAARRSDPSQLRELEAVRAERFALMDGLAKLPDDMVFFTQITMEAAEDPAFLQAMARARIRGALVGVEAVTPEGLKDVHKGFNLVGEPLVERLQTFRLHGVHVWGRSFSACRATVLRRFRRPPTWLSMPASPSRSS